MKFYLLLQVLAVAQALPVSHDFGQTINYFLKAIDGPATVTKYGEETMHCTKLGDVVECSVVNSADIKDLDRNSDELPMNFEDMGWVFKTQVKRDIVDELEVNFKRDCGRKCYCALPNIQCNPHVGAVKPT